MSKHLWVTAIASAALFLGTSAAQAQKPFRPHSDPNAYNPATQINSDIGQFTPEAQTAKMMQGMNDLLRQNQEIKAELDATKSQLDEMLGRLKSISNVLNTGTGESIGNMVRTIRDR